MSAELQFNSVDSGSEGFDRELSFGDRLGAAIAGYGRLCLGIDPHSSLLDLWGLPDSATGAREFGLRVIAAAAGRVGIVKPQVAFFERHGAHGYQALERVMLEARSAGLLVIADVKRGDIGSSVRAYGDAWLRVGVPLEADAMTVSPFLGLGSLSGLVQDALLWRKGVFVLAATSNPEAAPVQRSVLTMSSRVGHTVSAAIISGLRELNQGGGVVAEFGSLGVVLGATVSLRDFGIDIDTDFGRPILPVLAPGFGFQGAEVSSLVATFGSLAGGVIVSESRSILSAGSDGIVDLVLRHADAARQ